MQAEGTATTPSHQEGADAPSAKDVVSDDLTKRMSVIQEILDGHRTDTPRPLFGSAEKDVVETLRQFGKAVFDDFLKREDTSDLDRATLIYRASVLLCPFDHALRPQVLGDLGYTLCHRERWSRPEGDHHEKGEGQSLLQKAAQLSKPGTPYYLNCLDRLSHQRFFVFQKTGNSDDIAEAIRLQEEALTHRPDGHPGRVNSVGNLAVFFLFRLQVLGTIDDLEHAIQYSREALRITPELGQERMKCLDALANGVLVRFRLAGNASDLDEAIDLYGKSLEQPITGKQTVAQSGLGSALMVRFEQTSRKDDLDRGIELLRDSLSQQREGNPERANVSQNLANGLLTRHQQLGSMDDLHEAITLVRELAASTPSSAPGKPQALQALAVCLLVRYEQLARPEDIDEGIMLLHGARQLLPADNLQRSNFTMSLASGLLMRFQQRGKLDDIDEAIRLYRDALCSLPPGHPERALSLHNLSTALLVKVESVDIFGDEDINESILLEKEALEYRPPGHKDRWMTLQGVASCLHIRFNKRGNLDDLNQAIEILREALQLLSPDHPDRGWLLSNIAGNLYFRFEKLHAPTDMDESLLFFRESLSLLGAEDPRRPNVLGRYANGLRARYKLSGVLEDLEVILRLQQECLALLAPGHPHRAEAMFLLSQTLAATAEACVAQDDAWRTNLDEGVRLLAQAMNEQHHSPQSLLLSASTAWTDILKLNPTDHETKLWLLEIFTKIIQLIPRVAFFGLDVQSRLDALLNSQNIAANGAVYALTLSQPELALMIIEEGRGTFWSQALQLRTEFDHVPVQLRERLKQLSRQLEHSSLVGRDIIEEPLSKMATEAELVRRRHLAEEFDAHVQSVRALPGFEHFMMPSPVSTLLRAARKGPVVVLLSDSTSCHAIIIRSHVQGGVQHVPLPNINVDQLNKLAHSIQQDHLSFLRAIKVSRPTSNLGLKQLSQLWHAVVHPIVQALGLQAFPGLGLSQNTRKRLFWCATGAFSFVPLHAAGVYESRQAQCCSDFVVSSYTPTITALLNAEQPTALVPIMNVKALLVAEPAAPQMPTLPSVSEEVSNLASLMPPGGVLSLRGHDRLHPELGATVDQVTEKLSEANLVHFACHGVQDPTDALESGFCLRDGRLSVRKLMQFDLRDARFAFCSACETAKGDSKQPDQTIHLAAAMLFVGFNSIVATMWTMNDMDGPMVAKTVYRELLKGDTLDLDSIPYSLDAAIRKLRADGAPPSRWAPYIHMGC